MLCCLYAEHGQHPANLCPTLKLVTNDKILDHGSGSFVNAANSALLLLPNGSFLHSDPLLLQLIYSEDCETYRSSCSIAIWSWFCQPVDHYLLCIGRISSYTKMTAFPASWASKLQSSGNDKRLPITLTLCKKKYSCWGKGVLARTIILFRSSWLWLSLYVFYGWGIQFIFISLIIAFLLNYGHSHVHIVSKAFPN